MPTDRSALCGVAWRMALIATGTAFGCGPVVRPPEPPGEPPPPGQYAPAVAGGPTSATRQVVIGEMCPHGVAGRPAIAPLMMKTVDWSDHAEEIAAQMERGRVPRMTVFGTDGKSAGVFDTIGVAEIGMTTPVASGTYTGASPCSSDIGGAAAKSGTSNTTRGDNAACMQATLGCGLAVGELARPDDPPSTPTFTTGGACMSGDAIAVDIDGDNEIENFSITGILDPVRGPAGEWLASTTVGATCTPTFALYNQALVRPPEPGKAVDPKATVTLDLLGVVDLDGDGRKELVVALRFPSVRTIVVYTARTSPVRLELAGESASFPR